MDQETYFEITKRSIPIIKNETTYITWRNSIITVRSYKRVNFLEYSYNLESLERILDFKECTLLSPKTSPATEVCNASFLKSEMRNIDYTEMIVNSAFWPHNPSLTQEMTSVIMCKWSPDNIIQNECILAILNNIGGVEFFCYQQLQWKSVLNLSPHVLKALQYNKAPVFFGELKESVYILETSAICWAPNINLDKSCYFATAQKNGTVLLWKVLSNMNVEKVAGRLETYMTDITAMKWIPKSENKCFLLITNVLGEINGFDIQLENEIVNVQTYALWPHKDRMVPVSLKYKIIDDKIVFITSKHRHLLVQALNDDGTVMSQYLRNVNDHRITDIAYTDEAIYISIVNVKIYKININLHNNDLNVELVQLNLKEPYTTYDLYSLRFSKHNKLCALAMANRKVLCRKEAHKMEVIFISTESKLESVLPTLLNNVSRKMTYYWDCVELLRYQIIKLKIIPKLDYNELYATASHDSYKLKIYLIIMTFLASMKKLLRVCSDVTLPETSEKVVKEKILYLHAQTLLDSLCNKCQEEGKLSEIDMESLYGSKNYLEYYSKKYKTNIELDQNVLSALENNCEYVCQCCNEKIEGFTCKHGHLNMFCMVTFTPIMTDDYLICRCCGTTARSDLELINPLCVFCDLHLIKPD